MCQTGKNQTMHAQCLLLAMFCKKKLCVTENLNDLRPARVVLNTFWFWNSCYPRLGKFLRGGITWLWRWYHLIWPNCWSYLGFSRWTNWASSSPLSSQRWPDCVSLELADTDISATFPDPPADDDDFFCPKIAFKGPFLIIWLRCIQPNAMSFKPTHIRHNISIASFTFEIYLGTVKN